MRPHPRLAALCAALLILTGCTGDPTSLLTPLTGQANAPGLPADVFPGLPDRGNGVNTAVEAMTGDGTTLVMVATVTGRVSVPVLRSSTDGGETWQDGRLSEQAEAASTVGETALQVAAVARDGGERRWLAMGQTDESLIAWTSHDAHTWQRSPVTGIRFRKDVVTSVTGLVGGGFVAVGFAWRDDVRWPRVWTSADGAGWTMHKLPGEGWLVDVAANGDDVVAVGAHDLPQVKKGRSQYSLLFTSSDRGGTWKRRAVREPQSSDHFISQLSSVVATAGGFMVGGDYHDDYQDTYRPMLLQSTDLAAWFESPKLPTLGRSAGISELVQAGETTWAVQQSTTVRGKEQVTAYSLAGDRRRWQPTRAPANQQDASAVASAAAGDRALVAVDVEQRPSRVDLWTMAVDSPITATELAPPAQSPTNVQPNGLFVTDGALAAYGTSQGAAVWWAAAAPTGFATPTVIRDVAGQTVSRVTWGSGAGYLALADQGSDVFVLHSADGARWRATSTSTFNASAQYHWADLRDALWAHRRWLVVGEKSTNGAVRESALVATSANGLRWNPGRPARVAARGDWWGRNSPLDDLHGLENRGRSMQSVAALPRGMVAVGSFQSKQRTRPAAWLSSDNRTWRLLPLPAGGYPEARPEQVQRLGSVVVAQGWARPTAGTRGHRVIWRSPDAGRSWTLAPVKDLYRGMLLTASDREFIQVVLADDHRSVTVLRSSDGLDWASTPLQIDGLRDGMQVQLVDAAVTAAGLHVLLTLRNRLDGVSVVQTVPL